MSNGNISFRWGIPWLDEQRGGVYVYGFMLRNYARADVTRNEMMCIIHMSSFHFETPDGQASPSLKTIADLMGYAHENSVRNIIRSLQEKGMCEVTDRGGEGKTNIYNFAGFAKKMMELGGVHPNVGVGVHPNVPEEKEYKKKKDIPAEPEPVSLFPENDGEKEEKKVSPKLQALRDMVGALCEVMNEDINLRFSRYAKFASQLTKTGYTPEQIAKVYGPGGWWYEEDWRGQQGERPNEGTIRETIKQAVEDTTISRHDPAYESKPPLPNIE